MATQTLEFNATPGLTLTVKLFLLGSDTIVQSVAATAKMNDKGRYVAAFTDVPAGRYRLNAFVGANGGYANETYRLLLRSATFCPDSEQAFVNLESPERDTADTRAIEFDWPISGATFVNSASTCTRRFSGETGAQAEALSGAVTAVSGVSGRYSLAYALADRAADAATVIPTEVTYTLVDDAGNTGFLTLRIVEFASSTTGSGANRLTVTIADGVSAVGGAIVSAKQSNIVKAWGYSDGAGMIDFNLPTGAYQVEVQSQPGFSTEPPVTVSVPDTSTLTIQLTTQSVSPPSTPGLCTVRFFVLDRGSPVQGAIVQVELEDINPTVNTALVSRVVHSGTTDAQGIVDLVMIQKASFTRGGFYRIRLSDAGGRKLHDRRVYVPSVSTLYAEDLPDAEDFPT